MQHVPWLAVAAVCLYLPGIALWAVFALRCKADTFVFLTNVAPVAQETVDGVTALVNTTLIALATTATFIFGLALVLAIARSVQRARTAPNSAFPCGARALWPPPTPTSAASCCVACALSRGGGAVCGRHAARAHTRPVRTPRRGRTHTPPAHATLRRRPPTPHHTTPHRTPRCTAHHTAHHRTPHRTHAAPTPHHAHLAARSSPGSIYLYRVFNLGYNFIVFFVNMFIVFLMMGAFLWLVVAYGANLSIKGGVL
jgi:hypothetical protein